MIIKRIRSRQGKSLDTTLQCEFCGHKQQGDCYDDDYFRKMILVDVKCDKCGKSTD